MPDFVGSRCDTSDKSPGFPASARRRRRSCFRSWATWRVLANIDAISGRRQAQAEPERPRGGRPHLQAPGTAVRMWTSTSTSTRDCARTRPLAVARDLQDSSCELLWSASRALGEDGAGPAERVERCRVSEAREVPLAELGALDGDSWRSPHCGPARAPTTPLLRLRSR